MRLRLAILQKLKAFSILLNLSLLATCGNVPPSWPGKIYVGRSELQSIVRAQENDVIACSEDKFNRYLCMSDVDFQSFYETFVLGCSQWKPHTRIDASLLPKSGKQALKLLRDYEGLN